MSCDLAGRLRQAASVALSEYPVGFAYLFGSHAEGHARGDSDVDVAVVLTDGILGPAAERVASRCADALSAAAEIGGIELSQPPGARVRRRRRQPSDRNLHTGVDDLQGFRQTLADAVRTDEA